MQGNPQDVIKLDVPLFIRLLEYAREDAKTDMDLHDVADKIIELSAAGQVLDMTAYDSIMNKKVDEDKDLESEFILKQLRARHPMAKSDSEAIVLDYTKSQSGDRKDISRLDYENDEEEADIADLEQENDAEQREIDRLKQTLRTLQQR